MAKMNLSIKQKQTQGHREQTWWLPGWEGVWGRTEQDVGVSRCKLLYMEWINKKVLVFSTGNYIQYRGLNHHGREYLKKNVYIDV